MVCENFTQSFVITIILFVIGVLFIIYRRRIGLLTVKKRQRILTEMFFGSQTVDDNIVESVIIGGVLILVGLYFLATSLLPCVI